MFDQECSTVFAVHAPDLSVMCNTPKIFISWLLKHLYLDFSSNIVILLSLFRFVISFAFVYSKNERGEPVSASQSTSVFFPFVLTQHSPPVVLLTDMVFIFFTSTDLIVLTDDQSSISSFMYKADSGSLFLLLFLVPPRTCPVLSHVSLFSFVVLFVVVVCFSWSPVWTLCFFVLALGLCTLM